MPDPLDFFFFYGSTYTYLTVMRIEQVAARADVEVRWRPFNVREIMIEQNNIPFRGKPVKMRYMWRDIERRAARYGIPSTVRLCTPWIPMVSATGLASLRPQRVGAPSTRRPPTTRGSSKTGRRETQTISARSSSPWEETRTLCSRPPTPTRYGTGSTQKHVWPAAWASSVPPLSLSGMRSSGATTDSKTPWNGTERTLGLT